MPATALATAVPHRATAERCVGLFVLQKTAEPLKQISHSDQQSDGAAVRRRERAGSKCAARARPFLAGLCCVNWCVKLTRPGHAPAVKMGQCSPARVADSLHGHIGRT